MTDNNENMVTVPDHPLAHEEGREAFASVFTTVHAAMTNEIKHQSDAVDDMKRSAYTSYRHGVEWAPGPLYEALDYVPRRSEAAMLIRTAIDILEQARYGKLDEPMYDWFERGPHSSPFENGPT